MVDNVRLAKKYTRVDAEHIVRNGDKSGSSLGIPQTPAAGYAIHRVIVDIAILPHEGSFNRGAYIGDGNYTDADIGSGLLEHFFKWLELCQPEHGGKSLDPDLFLDSGFYYKYLGSSEEQVIGQIDPIPVRTEQ